MSRIIHTRGTVVSVGSLRFYGNDNGSGSTFIDRVEIRIDNAPTPADIGATDFTIELWLRTTAGNAAAAITPGDNYSWIDGNIFLDRDRFNETRAFGASLTAGRVTFGIVIGSAPQTPRTVRGTTDVRDGNWHHVAITRDADTGVIQVYVDGTREVNDAGGVAGDISYPNGATGATKDPFLVLGAEKHDADPLQFPSFFGYMTELRLSNIVRYTAASLTVPSAPFALDGDTLALYHFNQGSGTALTDADSNQSPGVLNVGGTANGPTWETASPFG